MKSTQKVPNTDLLRAGLELMRQNAKPLERIEAKGRAMIYKSPTGNTVRVRTCNDHVLVALADSPGKGARLNIEGTDNLLIVMPEVPRSRGPVIAYLVPTDVAVHAVRTTHEEWLATNPRTNGDNRTWNIWFDDAAPAKSNGFARKWAQYRIRGSFDLRTAVASAHLRRTNARGNLADVIAEAKRQIADAAGVPENAIRITIDLA